MQDKVGSSERFSTSKKGISNYIKIKPLSSVDPTKVVALAVGGMFLGGVIGMFSQIAKLDLQGTGELDPPSPNMEQLDPDLVIVYKQFMNAYFKLCPKRNIERYRNYVKRSIRHAEGIMLIEMQLLKKEIPRVPENRIQANAHALICTQTLRKVVDLFDSEIVLNVRDGTDLVYALLFEKMFHNKPILKTKIWIVYF